MKGTHNIQHRASCIQHRGIDSRQARQDREGSFLTFIRKYRNYDKMKTTLILRDELVRRAKARAALRGQPLSRYVEESLERSLNEDEDSSSSIEEWVNKLPRLSNQACEELNSVLESDDLRTIDPAMWK